MTNQVNALSATPSVLFFEGFDYVELGIAPSFALTDTSGSAVAFFGEATSFDYFGVFDGDGDGGADFGTTLTPTAFNAYTGFDDNYLAASDIDGGAPTIADPAFLTWSGLDISLASRLGFAAAFATGDDDNGLDADDFVRLEFRIDGGDWQRAFAFETDDATSFNRPTFLLDTDGDGVGDGAALTDAAQTFSTEVNVTGATLDLRLAIRVEAGFEDIGIDSIEIVDLTPPPVVGETFVLQILHASDLEGGVDAIERAPNFAAIVDALEDEAATEGWASILLSAGDNYLPGPFAGAASDPSLRSVLDSVYQQFYGQTYDIRENIGRVDLTIMNLLGFDASAIGNHEFDFGANEFLTLLNDDVRSPFSGTRWLGTQFPYLSSNLDFSGQPGFTDGSDPIVTTQILPNTAFQPAPGDSVAQDTAPKIAKATTIERDGEVIGVVGATTQRVTTISSVNGVTETTSNGTDNMVALAAALQPVIDDLINGADNLAGNADDVNKVILVSHLQDINLEKQLAGLLRGVDVIIAGGSDTRLADETDTLRPGDVADGDYPFQTTDADGNPLLIVSTDGEYSYVGRLVVEFDANGRLVNFDGGAELVDAAISGAFVTDDAGVVAVTGADTAQDAVDASLRADLVEQLVDAVSAVVTAQDANVFGLTDVFIEGRRELVRTEQTTLGDLSADANLAYAKSVDPNVIVSIKNGGGIRAAIGEVDGLTGELLPTSANPASGKDAGEVSQLDIVNALRFNNGLTLLTLSSADLAAVLEHAVASSSPGATPGQFPQVSGVRFSFDTSRPVGDRILNAGVFAEDGTLTAEIVRDGEVIGNPGQTFRIVTLNFLADGGDGYPFPALAENRVNLVDAAAPRTGVATFAADGSEQDAFAEYLSTNFATTPFAAVETGPEDDERIQNLAFRPDTVFGDVEPAAIVINEIDSDTPGDDAAEFVELFDGGVGNTALDGLTLVFFNGSNDLSYAAFDLDGFSTDANGYFLLGNAGVPGVDIVFPGNTLQNGADAVALYVGDAADFPTGTAATSANLLDAVVYDTNDADDAGLLGALDVTEQVNEGGNGGSAVDAVARVPNGTGDFAAQAPTPGKTNDAPADFDLQVTEIWAGQDGADVTADWFEITNFGTEAWIVAEGGLFYDDDSADPTVADLVQGVTAIAPGESVVVVIGDAADAADFAAIWGNDGLPAGTQVGHVDGAGLGQGGDAVALFLDAEGDGLAAGNTPFEVESFPDAASASGRSWEVAAVQFATLPDFIDTVATTETGGVAGDEAAIGSPGFIPSPLVVTLISAVQGTGAASPLLGQNVTVRGIVVGDYDDANELRGFFIQEESADADADATTSEGVFVFTGGAALNVAEGQKVTVTGVVAEFFGMTQISAAADGVTITDAGDNLALVTPTLLNRVDFGANEDASAFEAVEGMLVTFEDTLTVSEYFQLERFGQAVLYTDGRPTQFTQDNAPDAVGYAAHLAELAGRRIILDDTNNLNNGALVTDRVFHPQPDGFGVGVQGEDFFRGGDEIVSLTGVMHWSFAGSSGTDAWRVRPTEAAPVEITPVNTREDNAAPPEVGGELTVASFNVLNFFATIDTTASSSSGPVGPSGTQDARGADSQAELDRQLSKLTEALRLMDADIVALIELENDGNDASARLIVDSLNAELGAGTYALIETGFVGADAIKVGYIYQPGSVMPVGDLAILDDAIFVDPAGTGSDRNRPAIAVSWEEKDSGEIFTTVANHFKSKGAGGATGLDLDQGDGAGAFNHTRTLAAEALLDWLETDPTQVDDPDVLVLGDLNSYAREAPIQKFADAGFTNLAEAFDPDAYGYLFDGQLGTLDYALSSGTLTAQVTGAAEWHINADEVPLFDYNDTVQDTGEASFERRPGGNELFAADQWRTSDHDPVLVGLTLKSKPVLNLVEGGAGADRLTGTDAADLIIGGAGNNVLAGLGGADVFRFGDELGNGRRETTQIRDYEALVDIIDLGGTALDSFRETGTGVVLTVGADRDTIILRGITDFDQIRFADDFLFA